MLLSLPSRLRKENRFEGFKKAHSCLQYGEDRFSTQLIEIMIVKH